MIYLDADEIMSLLSVKRSKAYTIISTLNKELSSLGFITVKGKISKKYFCERIHI